MTATVNLDCPRGDSYEKTWRFADKITRQPYFWSGLTFAAQLRRFEDDTVFTAFTVDDTGQATGVVVMSLAKTVVATLSGVYVWDMQYTDPGGLVTTILKGTFTVDPDVTR